MQRRITTTWETPSPSLKASLPKNTQRSSSLGKRKGSSSKNSKRPAKNWKLKRQRLKRRLKPKQMPRQRLGLRQKRKQKPPKQTPKNGLMTSEKRFLRTGKESSTQYSRVKRQLRLRATWWSVRGEEISSKVRSFPLRS